MKREEFASKIRAKFPGSYDSLSDDDLVDKVIAKYPVYASQVDPADQPAPASPTKSLPRRALEAVVDSPAIPTIAGVGAGLATLPLAGPGAVGVAGVVGAGAEGYRQIAARALGLPTPQTSLEAGKGMLKEGAVQAASEAGGQVINYGLKATGAGRALENAAIGAARRALGFSKRFLNTPFSRREATQAARVALENDVIPVLGSPQVMFDNASKLANKAEQAITSKLKNIDFYKIAPDAEVDITQFGRKVAKGTDTGLFAGTVKPMVAKVKETILELYGRGATASEYDQAKNAVGETINYFADTAGTQNVKKKMVRSMADTVRATVKKYLPESYEEFLANQRLSNASLNMIKGLNNEVAGQMGNRLASPYAVLMAAGETAAGHPVKALGTLGFTEEALRRGAGTSARLLNEGAKIITGNPNAIGRIAHGTMGFGRTMLPKTREESQ